ncbi:unnamed protein product [Effrenium voratum]|uniref:Uncharacterized protein n=1 Tax=Effrenium voratum TaxID=2562239 RepID=A0AA36HYL1_9DINO|nr:unnamed protein product [Effrenium voratum]CAJ1456249.1 unnamed protein product [Effrenium voratum]
MHVAIPPEKWTQSVYSTPDSCLAKAEAEKLSSMSFDPSFFSSAYRQCIGRGHSHKDCVSSLPAVDTKLTPAGPLATPANSAEMASAVACISENGGDIDKCTSHFDALSKLAGYKEEEKKSSMQKGSEFASKAGWKMLALPVAYVGLKFIKIK